MSCNVFITGGGSKFGEQVVRTFLDEGAVVDTITSNPKNKVNLNSSLLNWNTADYESVSRSLSPFEEGEPYDYIIFNHNAGGILGYKSYGKVDKDKHELWTRTYFVNCQLVELCINKLYGRINANTKIITLISGIIQRGSSISDKHSGYCGMKSTLYYMMAGYKQHLTGKYICVNPGHFDTHEERVEASDKFHNMIKSINFDELYYTLGGDHIEVTYNYTKKPSKKYRYED